MKRLARWWYPLAGVLLGSVGLVHCGSDIVGGFEDAWVDCSCWCTGAGGPAGASASMCAHGAVSCSSACSDLNMIERVDPGPASITCTTSDLDCDNEVMGAIEGVLDPPPQEFTMPCVCPPPPCSNAVGVEHDPCPTAPAILCDQCLNGAH